ncbi:hypothetical protein [Streptomyces beihaiensis]|uniref:Oxidoreductase n=1 Tax=Streptomyces beihaiensis TaxID=2984495 RepID=A0ABT3U534_9ACTN|nr:hypothetical protein [Streptomyces beihaiensis]MCX3064185.1 hypothetical protein [Streptomyces beihaiensis]
MDPSDEDSLPLPPPFMFGCGDCARLLCRLARKIDADDGCLTEQLVLAKHLAVAHPDCVPVPHVGGCEPCAYYADHPEAADVWAEHRARSLFLPAAVARLL